MLGIKLKTKLGKWSVGLIIAMFILFFMGSSFVDLFYKSVSSGRTILEDIVKRPGVSLVMLAGFACGIIGFITGIIAIFKKKEHSILVYISTAIGALLILFLIGELLFPH